MQGATIRKGTYYRCTARTMAPGSPALADHPLTVNLREDQVVEVINDWLNELFARENRDATVAALLDGQSGVPTPDMDEAKARRADAEARLRRYQRAIGAGVEPAALVDAINQAQAERTAAQAYIDSAPLDDTLDVAEVYAMLDAYNELVDGLRDAPTARLARLYRHLDLSLRYLPDERAVFMRARPRVDSAGVRGGT